MGLLYSGHSVSLPGALHIKVVSDFTEPRGRENEALATRVSRLVWRNQFSGDGRRSSAAHGAAAACSCRLHSGRGYRYYNWSGFYIGGNLGAGWNSGGSVSDTFGSTFSGSGQTTKFLGGGQVGVNYEFWGGVVIGAEAMFDWLPNTTNTFNVVEGPADRLLVPLPRRRSTVDG